MFEKYLRPPFQRCLGNPLAQLIIKFGFVSPQLITLISCILGLMAALFVATGWALMGLLLLALSGLCDTLDGTVARLRQQASPLGSVMDIISDRIVEAAIVIALFAVAPSSRGLVCLVMLASILVCVTSFLVVGIFSENSSEKSFHYSPGLIERGEAFLFFGLMILLPSAFFILGWLFILLVGLTIAIRIWQFIPFIKNKDTN